MEKVKSMIGNMESTLETLKTWVNQQEVKEPSTKMEEKLFKKVVKPKGIMSVIRETHKNDWKNVRNRRILSGRKTSLKNILSKSRTSLALNNQNKNRLSYDNIRMGQKSKNGLHDRKKSEIS